MALRHSLTLICPVPWILGGRNLQTGEAGDISDIPQVLRQADILWVWNDITGWEVGFQDKSINDYPSP